MPCSDLTSYKDQVHFCRRLIKEGRMREVGTWAQGYAYGKLWCGLVDNFLVSCESIGTGPYMRAGSFKVRAK